MKNDYSNKNLFVIKYGISAFITILALNANLTVPDNNMDKILDIFTSFRGNRFLDFILFLIIAYFYKTTIIIRNVKFTSSGRKYIYFPAILFSLFMVIGASFKVDNSWQPIWGNISKVIRALIILIGYYYLFISIITVAFHYLDYLLTKQKDCFTPPHAEKTVILKNKLNWYINILEKNPFSVAFLTILFAYIPYIILSFPGIFMGDTSNQIAQCYNLKENTSNYLNLISENVRLNNHHPVVHSLLIHLFIMIGKTVFNSYNIGVFLYCSFQLVIVVSVIALLIKIYVKLNMNLHIVLFTMLYFIISPRIQNYMFLITKDIIFSSLLLLFVLMFYKAPESLKEKVIIAISLLGIILFRNDGKYLIILSAFITGILSKKLRRPMFSIIIGTICISTILSKIILPSFQITPSSRREVLSIPFQQTARYVRDAKSDVTPEEKRIISKILDYDSLAEKYDPNIADPVKATFNEYASTSDIKQYFQCWLQMFFKHPGIYLQAILNNKYRFFYPTSIPNTYSYSWSMRQMERTNKLTLDRVNTNFSYPSQLNTFRNIYEQFREVIFNVPVLSILLSTSTYTWLLILWTCYCLKQKNITSIIYLIPLYTQLFISMAGPCNGQYFRYLYPIAFCLPPSITLGFESLKTNFIKKEIQ